MMISLFCFVYKRLLEEVQINIGSTVPFASEYADDGFSRRDVDTILKKFFQEEFRLAEEYDLRYIFFIFLLGTDSVEILMSFKFWKIELTLPAIFKS